MDDWELLLFIWCLLAILTGVITLIADGARKRNRHLKHIDHVAHSKRVIDFRAYKVRMGAK